MNAAKIFATIVTAIALFPAASWADNVSGTTQQTNLESTTLGHGNTTVADTFQNSINLQKSKALGTNVSGTAQVINGSTTTIGEGNIDIKNAVQNALNGQKAK